MATISVEDMRRSIAAQYGPRWKRRVAYMPDNQVVAIFHRMCANGGSLKKKVKPSPPHQEEYYEQLSLFEPPRRQYKEMDL